MVRVMCFFFFQAEDGIRDGHVTGVQTCALPICNVRVLANLQRLFSGGRLRGTGYLSILPVDQGIEHSGGASFAKNPDYFEIGRASCRERGEIAVVALSVEEKNTT